MKKQTYLNALKAKYPQLAGDPKDTITLTNRGLLDLVAQAHDLGRKDGRESVTRDPLEGMAFNFGRKL